MVAHFANRLDQHLCFLEYGLAPIQTLILLLLLYTALSLSKGTLTLDLLLQFDVVNAKPGRSQLCKQAKGLHCTIPLVLASTYYPIAQRHLVLWREAGGLWTAITCRQKLEPIIDIYWLHQEVVERTETMKNNNN